jgi:hypothetical protein
MVVAGEVFDFAGFDPARIAEISHLPGADTRGAALSLFPDNVGKFSLSGDLFHIGTKANFRRLKR